jgi:aminopeptidase N
MRGIPRALARARAARIGDLRYTLHFDIPADPRATVHGRAVVSFSASSAHEPLLLDFAPGSGGTVEACACNGSRVPPDIVDGHLELPPRLLGDCNEVHVDFIAGSLPLNRRDEYLYTIFVPARAHEVFPCFDQPDLRGRFAVSLTIPAAWKAVANAPELPGDVLSVNSDRRTVRFAETQPIPTYLLAFAAGTFLESSVAGAPIRVFHRDDDAVRVSRNVSDIVEAHQLALAWLTDYTGIPYAFGKLDVVLVPAFQFGGMEHPGAIFYNAPALLLEPSATRQQLLARAHVIAHETAHMWFGNLVTMTWFDDVWMKEVFANLMAARIVQPLFPDLDHDLRFFHSHYAAAYDVDRTTGTNPIRQRLENLLDAGSLYGPIVYLKSAIVMRQFELALGAAGLRDVLREYLQRHRFGHGSWADLLDILAAHARFDFGAWGAAWIEQPGRPLVRTEVDLRGARTERIVVRQSDPDAQRRLTWPQRLDIALGANGETAYATTILDSEVSELTGVRGRPAPHYVLANGRGLGYGCFELDDRSREWLLSNLPEVDDALTRAAAWLTLWDGMLEGWVGVPAMLDLAIRLIVAEPNEMNLQQVLACTERLFWIFVPPEQRMEQAGRLEESLQTSGNSRGTTARAALFACLRNIATTDRAVSRLRAIWSDDAMTPGFELAEDDRIALALHLAVRGDDDVLRQQMARTRSGDRVERLAFIAPALSPDPRQRSLFLNTLTAEHNRRREPWVVEALGWLHHPLRSEPAVPLIAPSLELLEEAKRTGDIFLPRRWADATLAGHRSVEAAGAVRTFLDSRPPSYPPALRRVVLAGADLLFRSADRTVK